MLRIITILFFVSIFSSHAQVQINGHVQDEYGQPIIGVNIIEKDTSNGTLTDFMATTLLKCLRILRSFSAMSDMLRKKFW